MRTFVVAWLRCRITLWRCLLRYVIEGLFCLFVVAVTGCRFVVAVTVIDIRVVVTHLHRLHLVRGTVVDTMRCGVRTVRTVIEGRRSWADRLVPGR